MHQHRSADGARHGAGSVESLARVFVLLDVEDAADEDGAADHDHAHQDQEQLLEAGHHRRFGVVHVVCRGEGYSQKLTEG